ncbi:MAG: hypothetical protein U0X34_02890 [Bacteroidia bacterium]
MTRKKGGSGRWDIFSLPVQRPGRSFFWLCRSCSLDSLFRASLLKLNANGDCKLDFGTVLLNKYYLYTILQFGNKQVKDVVDALGYANRSVSSLPERPGCPGAYLQAHNLDGGRFHDGTGYEPTAAAARLLGSIQQYLNENQEVYFNLGGDALSDFTVETARLSAIEVEEEWHRNSEIIESRLKAVRFWVDGKPLRYSLEDLARMELVVGFRRFRPFERKRVLFSHPAIERRSHCFRIVRVG